MHTLEHLRQVYFLDPDEEAPRVVIYAPVVSPRLEYAAEFIFGHVLGALWRVTTNSQEASSLDCCTINYSTEEIAGTFRIKPNGLLADTGQTGRRPEAYFRDGSIYFFPTGEGVTGLHFDLFSAVFYFISRMEEWQPFDSDTHGRFGVESSLLFSKGHHLKPVVDEWILEFSREVRKLFPGFSFPRRKFRVVSTIDIDNLYAYRGKGWRRTLGGAGKDVLRFDFSGLAERLAVVCGLRNDPFDIYSSVSAFCRDKDIPLFYFFLVRSGTKFDRTIDPARGLFAPVIKEIGEHFIGLHPSYHSAWDENLLQREIEILEKASGRRPHFSRQHFLRFDIRSTPALLMRNGIGADFSMGYADSPGFRAGTSHPFHYYDFEKEQKGALLFVPFCMMDGAYSIHRASDARTALVDLLALATEIKRSGGFFTSVFHERTFSDRLYRGYGSLYKKLHARLREMEEE